MPQPRCPAATSALTGLVLVLAGALAPHPVQAQATFDGVLNGSSVTPPNASPGTGSTDVSIDGGSMIVNISFSGLSGTTTASHIHCCANPPANVAVAVSYVGFPTGVFSGVYANTFDLNNAATYQAAFITANGGTVLGARTALLDGIADGRAYACVHTTVFPGSEIRSYFNLESFLDGFEGGTPFDWSDWVGLPVLLDDE